MARPQSKIMTLAEQKVAVSGLKEAQKKHAGDVKQLAVDSKADLTAFDAAVKAARAPLVELEKQLASATKARDKAVKEATKVFGAATAKNIKLNAAADKGTAKLAGQLEAVQAVVPAAKAPAAVVAKAAIAKAAAKPAKDSVEA